MNETYEQYVQRMVNAGQQPVTREQFDAITGATSSASTSTTPAAGIEPDAPQTVEGLTTAPETIDELGDDVDGLVLNLMGDSELVRVRYPDRVATGRVVVRGGNLAFAEHDPDAEQQPGG